MLKVQERIGKGKEKDNAETQRTAEEEKKDRKTATMLATLQAGNNTQHLWMIAAGLGVGFLVVTAWWCI